jgi:hypothetical protein
MTATVDFKNAPAWLQAAIDSEGAFKKLNVRRSTANHGGAGSGLSDYDQCVYE